MRFGFQPVAHSRFVSRTAFDATPCTITGNLPEGRKQQLHTPSISLFCCRNKVMCEYYLIKLIRAFIATYTVSYLTFFVKYTAYYIIFVFLFSIKPRIIK